MQDTKTFGFTLGLFSTSGNVVNVLWNLVQNHNFKNVHSDVRAVYPRKDVIRMMIFAKFIACQSIRDLVVSDYSKLILCGKDVLYSVKNNFKINWRSALLHQAMESISKLDKVNIKANIAHEIPCLIIDDTDIPKRGKFIELIGKIFSHTGHNYNLGFKSLNLSYWTGKTTIHLDFSTHVEMRKDGNQGMSKKELNQRYSKCRPLNSHGSQRLSEAISKKTTVLIQMVKRAIAKGVEARYLLVDSWFFNSELVAYIMDTTLDIITRPKRNNWKYMHKNKVYTIGQLLNKYKNHKERKWSRKLNMFYVQVKVEFKGHPMIVYLYKPKKRGSKWQILISTHKVLGAIRAYEIYQNRWSIEVSYKDLKQYFRYGKCQSRDFIGQIADNTICLMSYNYMSMYKCINEYQSIGALFKDVKQNHIRPTLMEMFWEKFLDGIKKIAKLFNLAVDEIVEKFIQDDEFRTFVQFNSA